MPPKKVAAVAKAPAATKTAPVTTKKAPVKTTMNDGDDKEAEKPKTTKTAPTATTKPAVVEPVPQPQSSSDSESSDSDNDSSDSSDSDDSDDENELVQLPPPQQTTTTATPASVPLRTLKRTNVWLDIQVPPYDLGRVTIELFPDCPLAHENFRSLCTGEVTDPVTKEKLSYAGTLIDQIHDDYIVLGEICDDADDRDGIEIIEDDFEADNDDSDDETIGGVKAVARTAADKKGIKKAAIYSKDQKINIVHDTKKPAVSIYGGFFPDEPAGIHRQHVKAGTVSMFAEKTNRNGSKFLITLKPHMTWLDGQYTVIGQVTNGLRTLHSLISYKDTEETAVISNCGRLKKNSVGVDKVNDFLAQAVEIEQEKSPKDIKNTKATTPTDTTKTETQQITCPTCFGPAKYKSRQLGKGLRYLCRDGNCGGAFWIADSKYDETIVNKAIELKKEAKKQAHIDTMLMQSAAYRKQAKKERKATAKAAAKAGKEIPSQETKSNKTIVFASPDLAIQAQSAMAVVVAHKKEKAKAALKGRKDHEQYVKEKKIERGELDENGEPFEDDDSAGPHKRKFNANGGDDKWIQGGGKRGKGNNEKSFNREMKKIYNDRHNPEHKDLHEELSSMSKDDRRQFKRQIGIQPGPSKTKQTNMNKRGADPKAIPKKATYNSVKFGARTASNSKKPAEPYKKKDKSRWKDRDAAALPDGFVSRAARRKELQQ